MNYFAHETAVIDNGSQIGTGTKIWHFSHIMPDCIIGENCNIGQNVVISPNVILGNNVKIQNNVSVYTGVICEDDVFLGPSMVFTNVINPRSHVNRKEEYKQTFVRKGASIGANATIVCGNEIGEYALIGAGAVITKEVKPYALMVGNPAKQIGWVSKNGHKLSFNAEGIAVCPETGEKYRLENEKLKIKKLLLNMNNFRFYSPTEFVFGKNTEKNVGTLVKKYGGTKVLVHYGGSSAIKSGLLAEVELCLKNEFIDYVLLGGVQPNPTDTLVYEGIALCKKEKINFILAVGGGSVIDSAKAIAAGAVYAGDFWNFFEHTVTVNKALPVGTILTIPAAGSEGSANTVITKVDGKLKRGIGSPALRPVFSIMDPVLTYTLPAYQSACGISDMMAHIMERYFTQTTATDVTDRLCEALLQTIIKEGPINITDPEDYDARANIMWAGTLAHNGVCGVGREEDWASHGLEHELSAHYNVAHGAGLAVMFPAWMQYVYTSGIDRFIQFATRVWNIPESSDKKETALKGIQALKDFFTSIGLPVNMEQLGIKNVDIDLLLETLQQNQGKEFGFFQKLNMEDARKIYQITLA